MTARRDQGLLEYALDLGYEETGQTGGDHLKLVHSRTGAIVHLALTPSDYRAIQNAMADLRRGAGASKRGRAAVVNGRRAKRAKRGANSERLRLQGLAKDQTAARERAEARWAQIQRVHDAAARPAHIPAEVLARLAEIRQIEGLMRGD